MDIMQLCRLCLVKDQVNIPIFGEQGDIRQIFLKITACLPVKVSKEDNLPKKICDGCLYKLELLYQFWNTTVNAEKQLLEWLNQAGLDANKKATDGAMAVVNDVQDAADLVLKEEAIDITEVRGDEEDDLSTEANSYILQQQQLPYQTFEYQQDGTKPSDDSIAAAAEETTQPPAKRQKVSAAPAQTIVNPETESDDDIDTTEMKLTKVEDDSDGENPEPTTFVGVDNEQPGPSGVGKTAEAPSTEHSFTGNPDVDIEINYECEICQQIFKTKTKFLQHRLNNARTAYVCCSCGETFKSTSDLYAHYELHKEEGESIVIQEDSGEFDYATENVEAVMNIPNQPAIADANELLYILDDSQCVNEVVIDEDQEKETGAVARPENITIVQVEHGYMIPKVFKGQLECKKRRKRQDSGSENEQEAIIVQQPSTSRLIAQARSMKRRHEMPDFSAANYVHLSPTPEVDIPHFKCLRCEQLFINKFVFFRHIEKGKCYVNSCDVCDATFQKNSEFYDHYVLEHTDRAICNFCFRTFMYEKNVKEHMLRHLDQFRHRCEECHKGFYTVREYRNHYKNRHMGIRHKCEVCGRSFADEYYFKRHIATHAKAVRHVPTSYIQIQNE